MLRLCGYLSSNISLHDGADCFLDIQLKLDNKVGKNKIKTIEIEKSAYMWQLIF